jgi:hypothetical protein
MRRAIDTGKAAKNIFSNHDSPLGMSKYACHFSMRIHRYLEPVLAKSELKSEPKLTFDASPSLFSKPNYQIPLAGKSWGRCFYSHEASLESNTNKLTIGFSKLFYR